jgi:hypothetical protein
MLGEGRASTPCLRNEEGVDGTPSRAMTNLWVAVQRPIITLFCNGPPCVNPFKRDPVANVSLLSGVGARPPPDGI